MSSVRRPLDGTASAALDAADSLASHRMPLWLIDSAQALAGCPVGLYTFDISGTSLEHVAGACPLGASMSMPQTLGPELPEIDEDRVLGPIRHATGTDVIPLWLRGRAVAVLVATQLPARDLTPFAREAAGALEIADRYTDVMENARRRRRTMPAAELQEMLLPPRITAGQGIEVVGTVIPAYDVGGDWFDYAEDPGGTWLAVADFAGKGPRAAAFSALCLGAFRSARRQDASIQQTAQAVDAAVLSLGEYSAFITAVLARWRPGRNVVQWASLGHPSPLLIEPDGTTTELDTPRHPPLGVVADRTVQVSEQPLARGQRLLLYSDGVTERRVNGPTRFGVEGLVRAARSAGPTAAELVVSVLESVTSCSDEDLVDDATLLAIHRLS